MSNTYLCCILHGLELQGFVDCAFYLIYAGQTKTCSTKKSTLQSFDGGQRTLGVDFVENKEPVRRPVLSIADIDCSVLALITGQTRWYLARQTRISYHWVHGNIAETSPFKQHPLCRLSIWSEILFYLIACTTLTLTHAIHNCNVGRYMVRQTYICQYYCVKSSQDS